MNDYKTLLESKVIRVPSVGFDVPLEAINPALFPYQKDIVKWGLRKGRAAVFAATGMGKTAMQVEMARFIVEKTNQPVLIVAPLTVAKQTVNEARNLLGVEVKYVRSQTEITGPGIYITNYEMIEHFDAAAFGAVLLDESSILKGLDGATRRLLTDMFAHTPHRYCFTATPAPNDITEIGRHSEFLGLMSNAEMLAAFFINDMKMKDGTYRLKRHGIKKFYEWLASWGMAISKPSDLGYSDDDYNLPPLTVETITVDGDYTPEGMLPGFTMNAISATEAKSIRRMTTNARVERTAELVNASGEQWVIWAGLNDEAELLEACIPGSVNVHGSMSPEVKSGHIEAWLRGEFRVLISKVKIAGFGINMQNASKMVFCGIDYSWEGYFQAVRRCWRFGQKNPVNVYVITSNQEMSVLDSILRKEKEAVEMTKQLTERASEHIRAEITGHKVNDYVYRENEAEGAMWKLMQGDSCERMAEIPDNSVDMSVFSPPFMSLYTYTPTERDLGNSRNNEEFFAQFGIIISELLRITKPGRNACVHVQQIAASKVNDGYIGIKDFRGDVIRAFIAAGWIFHGEVTVDKNPQVQAIRTKAKGLMFVQKNKDSAASRPAFADYVLMFQKPGENAVPIHPECTNDEWIVWAHPVWYDINETDTLNVAVARGEEDERHLCALQLPLIERCIRLYSNRGETVFTPFLGIGSEIYEAVRLGRRGLGIELKEEYWKQAVKYVNQAETLSEQKMMF